MSFTSASQAAPWLEKWQEVDKKFTQKVSLLSHFLPGSPYEMGKAVRSATMHRVQAYCQERQLLSSWAILILKWLDPLRYSLSQCFPRK